MLQELMSESLNVIKIVNVSLVAEKQLSPQSADHGTRLTPTDDGYHSNGGPDESLTPPEDSSDSDSDNNYVLDFSCKKEKRVEKEKKVEQVSLLQWTRNENQTPTVHFVAGSPPGNGNCEREGHT